jgi:hypothetical protein
MAYPLPVNNVHQPRPHFALTFSTCRNTACPSLLNLLTQDDLPCRSASARTPVGVTNAHVLPRIPCRGLTRRPLIPIVSAPCLPCFRCPDGLLALPTDHQTTCRLPGVEEFAVYKIPDRQSLESAGAGPRPGTSMVTASHPSGGAVRERPPLYDRGDTVRAFSPRSSRVPRARATVRGVSRGAPQSVARQGLR